MLAKFIQQHPICTLAELVFLLLFHNEFSDLVAHTGFEPVISALRGRRPKPARLMRHNYSFRMFKNKLISASRQPQLTLNALGHDLQKPFCPDYLNITVFSYGQKRFISSDYILGL